MSDRKSAIVCHSGGMDSSICLKLAIAEYGADAIVSVGFDYGQRHGVELQQAAKIASDWGVERVVIDLSCLNNVTTDALTDSSIPIEGLNTLVVGRNGLMARLCAIYGYGCGANRLYMGVMGLEEANSGYRDCSRGYMDMMQEILRVDLGDEDFQIITPLVSMTKAETMALASRLGILDYLLAETVTCYEGVIAEGCGDCPACLLRAEGIAAYRDLRPA